MVPLEFFIDISGRTMALGLSRPVMGLLYLYLIPSYSAFRHWPNHFCDLQWPIFHVNSLTVHVFNKAPNSEDIGLNV
jgi:hypothetical protein